VRTVRPLPLPSPHIHTELTESLNWARKAFGHSPFFFLSLRFPRYHSFASLLPYLAEIFYFWTGVEFLWYFFPPFRPCGKYVILPLLYPFPARPGSSLFSSLVPWLLLNSQVSPRYSCFPPFFLPFFGRSKRTTMNIWESVPSLFAFSPSPERIDRKFFPPTSPLLPAPLPFNERLASYRSRIMLVFFSPFSPSRGICLVAPSSLSPPGTLRNPSPVVWACTFLPSFFIATE